MNANRKYLAITAVIALIAIGIGVFFFTGSTGSTAPAAPATAQAITVKAKDTNGVALNGVAVQVNGAGDTKVAGGTITTGGQISLSFDPEPGTYVVSATEPTGYRARDDKDGGASNNAGLTCASVYLCIYLTATEVQDATGTKSIVVTLTHTRPEQVDELDDLWFEMTPPAAADEEISFVEPAEENVLISEAGTGPLDEQDETPIAAPFTPPPGLGQVCFNTQHQPVEDQNAASGIWIKGEVYGLDGGWIWVEGPTFNGGEPVQLPVEGGQFDGPLGINSYGDHEVERFELQGPGADDTPIDLLPLLLEGPGTNLAVDADEGPIFDSECFDFEAPTADDAIGTAATDDLATEQRPEQLATERLAAVQAEVDAFFDAFVDDHIAGNTADLLDTLHPAIPLAFGEATCTDYVTRTTGSITGATVLQVDLPQSVDMETPDGLITFSDAVPVTVEFTLADGSTAVNDANLADHDGQSRWLTRCGVDG